MDFTERIIRLKELLINNGLKLKIAESFTGGYISSLFTSIEGASLYLNESIVCYSPESKINRLNVNKNIIESYGTVSLTCLKAMIKGLLNSINCDIALATTGNASASIEKKSVTGDCFIGVASKSEMRLFYYRSRGNRKEIIEHGADEALKNLTEMLK